MQEGAAEVVYRQFREAAGPAQRALPQIDPARYEQGMCTVVILRRPGENWPVLLAANRDEMIDRPWSPPARHWPDRPNVVAGRDLLAGGTWLGLNDRGVVAAILNRPSSLGPRPDALSRGELPLLALEHSDAAGAATALSRLPTARYRTFNMVVADARQGFWLRSMGGEGGWPHGAQIEAWPLPAGLSMITAHDRNDIASPRIRDYLPQFEAASPPDPDRNDWRDWQRLLADEEHDPGAGLAGAMCIPYDGGFGTVSSSLIALPSPVHAGDRPVWRFAAGRPGDAPHEPVAM